MARRGHNVGGSNPAYRTRTRAHLDRCGSYNGSHRHAFGRGMFRQLRFRNDAGSHKCLHTGEFCTHAYDVQYRHYGFRCIRWYANVRRYRLTYA